jgi:hypothetical protein
MTERGGGDLFFAATAEAAREHGVVEAPSYVDEKKLDSQEDIESPVLADQLDGYVAPTDEELQTLRRVADKMNWATYSAYSLHNLRVSLVTDSLYKVIAFVEMAERFSVRCLCASIVIFLAYTRRCSTTVQRQSSQILFSRSCQRALPLVRAVLIWSQVHLDRVSRQRSVS